MRLSQVALAAGAAAMLVNHANMREPPKNVKNPSEVKASTGDQPRRPAMPQASRRTNERRQWRAGKIRADGEDRWKERHDKLLGASYGAGHGRGILDQGQGSKGRGTYGNRKHGKRPGSSSETEKGSGKDGHEGPVDKSAQESGDKACEWRRKAGGERKATAGGSNEEGVRLDSAAGSGSASSSGSAASSASSGSDSAINSGTPIGLDQPSVSLDYASVVLDYSSAAGFDYPSAAGPNYASAVTADVQSYGVAGSFDSGFGGSDSIGSLATASGLFTASTEFPDSGATAGSPDSRATAAFGDSAGAPSLSLSKRSDSFVPPATLAFADEQTVMALCTGCTIQAPLETHPATSTETLTLADKTADFEVLPSDGQLDGTRAMPMFELLTQATGEAAAPEQPDVPEHVGTAQRCVPVEDLFAAIEGGDPRVQFAPHGVPFAFAAGGPKTPPLHTNTFYSNLFILGDKLMIYTYPYAAHFDRDAGFAVQHTDALLRVWGPETRAGTADAGREWFYNPIFLGELVFGAVGARAYSMDLHRQEHLSVEVRVFPERGEGLREKRGEGKEKRGEGREKRGEGDGDAYTDVLRGVSTDAYTDTFADSFTDTFTDSFTDTFADTLTDAFTDALKAASTGDFATRVARRGDSSSQGPLSGYATDVPQPQSDEEDLYSGEEDNFSTDDSGSLDSDGRDRGADADSLSSGSGRLPESSSSLDSEDGDGGGVASGDAPGNANPGSSADSQNYIELPLVEGMGMFTAIYHGNLRVQLRLSAQILWVEREHVAESWKRIQKYRVLLNNNAVWLVHVALPPNWPHRFVLQAHKDSIVALAAVDGLVVQLALAPDSEDLDAYYYEAAGMYVTGATLHGSHDCEAARVELRYATEGASMARAPLTFVLPHHMENLDASTKHLATKLALDTPTKGAMVAFRTSQLVFNYPANPGVQWMPWAEGMSESSVFYTAEQLKLLRETALLEALGVDIYTTVMAERSTYFRGKALDKYAHVLLILHDVLKEKDVAHEVMRHLQRVLDEYRQLRVENPLIYDTTFGGICAKDGLADPQADFGNAYYNDHHYHYSYFVHAAAVVAKVDSATGGSWLAENSAWVTLLVRDVATPVADDRYFPQFRAFDWFQGHSWSRGVFVSNDGKDEESSSEDYHFSYAMKLWGQVIGDHAMAARGDAMLSVQKKAFQLYFLYEDDNKIVPLAIAFNKVCGIFFENKIHYTTWFGNRIDFIHGIQMIPLTAAAGLVRSQKFAREEWRLLKDVWSAANDGWKGILALGATLFDPEFAWDFFAADDFDKAHLDGGQSRTWALAFAAAVLNAAR